MHERAKVIELDARQPADFLSAPALTITSFLAGALDPMTA